MTRAALLALALLSTPLWSAKAGDADPPKDAPKPAAEEFVYEGRPAADWVKDLRAGQNSEKAAHALLKLGKDAVPGLVQLLKERDARLSGIATNILTAMKHNRDAVAIFSLMLKDSDFDVRRQAIAVLGEFAPKDPAARQALTDALKDRDKAVAEAAEKALEALEDQKPVVDRVLTQAIHALEQGQWDRAAALASDALRLDPQNEKANKIIDLARNRVMQDDQPKRDPQERLAADELRAKCNTLVMEGMTALKNGDNERAVALAQRVLELDPNSEQARRLMDVARKNPQRARDDVPKKRADEPERRDF